MSNSTLASILDTTTGFLPRSHRFLWYRAGLVSLLFVAAPLNLAIIALTLKYDFGKYKWFLLNLATLDTLASGAYALQGLMHFFPTYDGFWCAMAGFAFPFSLMSAYTNLLPISFNRFVAIVAGQAWYERIFTGRNILAICLASDLAVALLLVPGGLVFGRPGRRTRANGDCNLIPRNGTSGSFDDQMTDFFAELMAFIVLPVVGVSLLANMAIYTHVWRHLRRSVVELAQRDRLEQTRQICRATLLQALAPLAFQLPFAIVQTVDNATPQPDDTLKDSAYFLVLLVCSLPIADAVITLYVVGSYRRKLLELLNGQTEESDNAKMQGKQRMVLFDRRRLPPPPTNNQQAEVG